MSRSITRREFHRRLALTGAGLALAGLPASARAVEAARRDGTTRVRIRPGHTYAIELATDDGVSAGSRWEGDTLRQFTKKEGVQPADQAAILAPMFRQRLVLKIDDMHDRYLGAFQRYVEAVEKSGGKADLGVCPGLCGEATWEWLRSLDPARFEVWNHTLDHGRNGARHHGQPYDVQVKHLQAAHDLVREKLGITMHAFGVAGIRPYKGADTFISDGDELTYYAVRNQADYHAFFGGRPAATNGPGKLNVHGLLILLGTIDLEHPDGLNSNPETRDYEATRANAGIKKHYPEEDARRVPGVGNGEECIWRLHHPYGDVESAEEAKRMPVVYTQCHPWNWNTERGIESVARWVSYAAGSDAWRFSNVTEAYRWMADRGWIVLQKETATRYVLDAHTLRFDHEMEMALPEGARVVEKAYLTPEITKGRLDRATG